MKGPQGGSAAIRRQFADRLRQVLRVGVGILDFDPRLLAVRGNQRNELLLAGGASETQRPAKGGLPRIRWFRAGRELILCWRFGKRCATSS
jgi:hypothetical protein